MRSCKHLHGFAVFYRRRSGVSQLDFITRVTRDLTSKLRCLPEHCWVMSLSLILRTWSKLTTKHGVDAVGDKADARKAAKYAEMAAAIDMEFQAIVLYTYGGFHKSAISFIGKLTESLDPATCLISRAGFRQQLKQHIAIAVQRG